MHIFDRSSIENSFGCYRIIIKMDEMKVAHLPPAWYFKLTRRRLEQMAQVDEEHLVKVLDKAGGRLMTEDEATIELVTDGTQLRHHTACLLVHSFATVCERCLTLLLLFIFYHNFEASDLLWAGRQSFSKFLLHWYM